MVDFYTDVFAHVAEKLSSANLKGEVSDFAVTDVLVTLGNELTELGWTDFDEAMNRFPREPHIQAALTVIFPNASLG